MRPGEPRKRGVGRFIPYAIVALVAAVVTSLAISSPGIPDRVLDLNNSGVWVTNDSRGLFGRVNRSAGSLDAGLIDPVRDPGPVDQDVFQDGEAVVAWTKSQSRLFAIDTRDAVAAASPPVNLGPSSAVAMGGGVIAAITSDKGEIRTSRYFPTGIPDLSQVDSDYESVARIDVSAGIRSRVDVAVDSSGRVFAASTSGEWALIDESGIVSTDTVGQTLSDVAVSLVGGIGVVVDPESGDVFLTDGTHVNLGPGVLPQQPGQKAAHVVLATPSGLVGLRPGGGISDLYRLPEGPVPSPQPSGQPSPQPSSQPGEEISSPDGPDAVVARPVVMGSAVYGAWGGTPGRTVKLDQSAQESIFPLDGAPLVTPVFRVNRGSVILNDVSTGALFDIDEKWAMDNWDDVEPESDDTEDQSDIDDQTVKAQPDQVWARPGWASIIHVLDNDVNPGTGIMAVTEVSGQDADRVEISPDGQTLVADVPDGWTGDMKVTYTVTNRSQNSDDAESSADVTISMRSPLENNLPYQLGSQGQDEAVADYTVPSSGSLPITPVGWWRDADSDALTVVSATVGGRVLPVSAQGLIQYSAPATPGEVTERIDYLVSDGIGQPVVGNIHVRVLSSTAVESVPPVAMPDSVRGLVGESVVFYPLDNDLPGCDPLNKQAQLAMASPVGGRVGLDVSTDLLSGAVTVTADHAGPFFLDYAVSFGSAYATGKIRVDIRDQDKLVAMPDSAVVRGTVPVMVDLLANDRDPMGSVLTVLSATPADPDRVRVGVVRGRWLRVEVTSSVVSSAPTSVSYQVTNGRGEQATGQVVVTQVPAVATDHVSVVDDYARVRVGDVATIPVLDNDSSESGEPLVLNDNVESMMHAGQLRVEDPSAPIGTETQNVGQAFVDGNKIRYEAPATGDQSRRVRIEYQAGVASGSPMTGYVWVDVVPEPGANLDPGADQSRPRADSAPTPESVEARAVVGDVVRVPVQIYGQDPDGDSVTVAGLRTPPKYGQVVKFGADWLQYESYPSVGMVGTDSFQFYVQDRFGALGIGTARIGLAPPSDAPAPFAVDDVVMAQPGATVTVYPRDNDVVAIGSGDVGIVMEDSSQAAPDGSVSLVAPKEGEPSVSVGYHLDAGGVSGTSAQILVRSQLGYLNPPNVYDHEAESINGQVASVDVLDDAWDVDGPVEQIHILSVGGQGSFTGSVISVPLTDRGQVVPFQVEDGDGAQAMAVVFVPSLSSGRPSLRADQPIVLDKNGSKTVDLNDYIASPRHRDVYLTVASQMWTAPSTDLVPTVASNQSVMLAARNDYVGPAALTVEVRDSPDATDPDSLAGVVTIPVQIGEVTPVLRCPDAVQDIIQGGEDRVLDVASLCHAWMPTQDEINKLRFTASWTQDDQGVQVLGRDGGSLPSDRLTVRALPESQPGAEAIMTVGVAGYDVSAELHVRVIAAPKPTMSVSSVTDVQQGTVVSVPVTVTSPMRGAAQNIVSVSQTSGPSAGVSFDDRTIQVTPDSTVHGILIFDVVASDIQDDARTDRQVTRSFSVTVYGIPDPPSSPQPGTQLRSKSAVVSYIPGGDNGAPITGYEVQWDGGSRSCGLNTTCEIPNLVNGNSYRFQVRATNKAGPSPWSEWGAEVIPNAMPGAVTDFAAANPECGALTLSWSGMAGEGSAPTAYHLSWAGSGPVAVDGSQTNYRPTNLDNDTTYVFTIVAENQVGLSQQPVTVRGQSSCRPLWSGSDLTITPQDLGSTAQILLSWPPADPQGPEPVTYQVTRTGNDGTVSFAPTTSTSMGDSNQITYAGQTYTYSVQAVNQTGGEDHTSNSLSGAYTAIGTPAAWSTVGGSAAVSLEATGRDGVVRITANSFPEFRDASGEVRVTIDGAQVATLTPGAPSVERGGYANGKDLTAEFTACNTKQACNSPQSAPLKDGPFGELGSPALSVEQGPGRNVCFTASGDGNGRGATLVVAQDGAEVYRSTTLDTGRICRDAGAWDASVTFTASLETADTAPPRANPGPVSQAVRSAMGTPEWAAGSVSLTATGANGTALLTIATMPVSNGGSLTLYYFDANGQKVRIFGQQATITGLTNGVRTQIRVQADNGVNTADVDPSPAVTTYGPLDRPVINSIQGHDTSACVEAATAANGTNGAPASLRITSGSTVIWESGMQTGQIASGPQCLDTGGHKKDATFVAQVITDPAYTRSDSPTASAKATSPMETPPALSGSDVVISRISDGQAVLTLVGAFGPDVWVQVDYLGLSTTLSSAISQRTLSGFTNGNPTTVTLTPCNVEQCNSSGATTLTVTTYGALSLTATDKWLSTGKTVCASFTANPNGARATVTITNDATSDTISTPGTTAFPAQLCTDPGAPGVLVTFTATLTDDVYSRDSVEATAQIMTPLDPTLTLVEVAPKSGDPSPDKNVCISYQYDTQSASMSFTGSMSFPDDPSRTPVVGYWTLSGSGTQLWCADALGPEVRVSLSITMSSGSQSFSVSGEGSSARDE